MKKVFLFLGFLLFLGCSSQKSITQANYDDVYYQYPTPDTNRQLNVDYNIYITIPYNYWVYQPYWYQPYQPYWYWYQSYQPYWYQPYWYQPYQPYWYQPYQTYWHQPYHCWLYQTWNHKWNQYNNWNIRYYYGPRKSLDEHQQKQNQRNYRQQPKYDRNGNIQRYTSPEYKQPRSSKEYINYNNGRFRQVNKTPRTQQINSEKIIPKNRNINYERVKSDANKNQQQRDFQKQNTNRLNPTPSTNPSYSNPNYRNNSNYSKPRPSTPRSTPTTKPNYSTPSYSTPRSTPSNNRTQSGGRR